MNMDMIIPFMPRVVQDKLKPPRLNVAKISKEPKTSQETREEKYYKHRLAHKRHEQLSDSETATESDEKDTQEKQKSNDERHHHIDILI
ncbi:hypothetical protein [Catenovulum sediminis]|uniref:hypothetical protein n=1 Tax=Catenovulum sediminis TaxID=1740262 RepID=UPI00117E5D90|nr:hypothetical protein [Catenovulum sediminis]